MTKIKTVCPRDCPDTCFIDVEVKDNKIVSVKGSTTNPVTQGFLCPRGRGDPARVYSKDRVLYPHVRSRDNNDAQFERVSWEEAIQFITNKLQETIQTHGDESILLLDYAGNQGFLAMQYPHRLWNAIGATKTDYALCSTSGHKGIGLQYGLAYGVQPEELLDMEVITYWGNNAKVSSSHMWALSHQARKDKGTTIISIDPRNSETSQAADMRISPQPGSDVALTYGIARYLIDNDLIDTDFIEKNTVGFQQYKEEVLTWTPERLENITGVSWDNIAKLGSIYANAKSVTFMIGLGLQKSLHGAEAARAVSLLPALLGYARGFHYSDSRGRYIDFDYLNGSRFTNKKSNVVHHVDVGSELVSGKFKFVFVYGCNPAVTLPNQRDVRSGFSKEDVFTVVHDTHWTETTYLADVILPASTYLEKDDLNFSDHHLYTRLSNKAIEPLGESKDEVTLMHTLAQELGLKEEWLFEDPWKALNKTLAATFQDGTLDDLREGKELKLKLKPMNEYQTQSGKIEFYSSEAEKLGFNPLPEQLTTENEEGWFVLLNSSIPKYTHSQFIDVYGPIPQIVWINPKDAKRLDIKNNDMIKLFNDLGEVIINAIVTNNTLPGVLWAPRPLTGIEGQPLNVLADGTPQVIGSGPRFNSIKVKVKLAE